METTFIILASMVFIILGYYELKEGIRAFRNREKNIGFYIPQMSLFMGIILIIAGFGVIIKMLIKLLWA
jgi:uncharacterized membrane protein YidH (DUF202 family)